MSQPQTCRQENTAILYNNQEGGIAIVCGNPGKNYRQPNKQTSWRSERSEKAESAPTCCRQRHEYPPGYTVFECRVDGNQPIAQVVQVPSDTTDNFIQNKTCMLLETKQSEFGPSSRVVAYSAETPSCRTRRINKPMSFALEARDCPAGAVARAEKVAEHVEEGSPMCYAQPVTVLETTKGSTCKNGPSSRIVYNSVLQEAAKCPRLYETPGYHIQCTTTHDGPIARVTQVPQKLSSSSRDPGTTYEAFVHHDGSSPTAVVTHCNEKLDTVQSPCEFLETRVDASGPRARALTLPEGSPNFRNFTHLDARPQKNGTFARITQQLGKPLENISNLSTKRVNALNYKARPVSCPQCPVNPVMTCNQPCKQTCLKLKPNIGKRNGLSPTNSGKQLRTGSPLKNCRIRKAQRSGFPKFRKAEFNRPVSSPDARLAVCEVKPGACYPWTIPASDAKLKSAFPNSVNCECPVQHACESTDLPFSAMRPLPGGSFVPQCPPPSLPEIAPVSFGVNNFRNYAPSKPKASRSRKSTSTRLSIPNKPLKIILKPKKTTKPTVPKKEFKNKKTGSSGKHRISMKTRDQGKDKPLTPDPAEKYVDCPAFSSKEVQSLDVCKNQSVGTGPALESKGSQCVRVSDKSSGVKGFDFESEGVQPERIPEITSCIECLAVQSERRQSVRVLEKPSSVKCPAFETEKHQPIRVCKKPSFIECPDFVAVKCQQTRVCKEPNFVECPAFEAEKRQSFSVCEKSTHVKRPHIKPKANQSVQVCKNQLYVECPAFESRDNQLDLVPEEPSYMSHLKRIKSIYRSEESDFIKCPAFTSRKSSETSSVYVPRDELLVSKYSEYFQPKTITTAVDYCAKKNRRQDECRLHIPSTVLRMSYEQRRNRHARTLLSNGSQRRRFDDEDADMGVTYCEQSSKSQKRNRHEEPQSHHPARSSKDKKKDVEQIGKSLKSTPQHLTRTCKLGLKRVKSRELRAGVVYYDCDCYHFNGLQHECPRGGCGGKKHCLTTPWPKCKLSGYFKQKWSSYNEILDLTPPSTFCGPRDALYRAKMMEENHAKYQRYDNKFQKPQAELQNIKGKPADKTKNRNNKGEEPQIKNECHQVHEKMVQQYAIIPVVVDQHHQAI